VINETALVVSQLNEDFSRTLAAEKPAAMDEPSPSDEPPSASGPGVSEGREKMCHGATAPAVREL
jgi:hypothetical protein